MYTGSRTAGTKRTLAASRRRISKLDAMQSLSVARPLISLAAC